MSPASLFRLEKKYKRDRKLGRMYLFLFFVFVGIHKLDQIQQYFSGVSIKTFTVITPLLIPPIFLFLAFWKYRKIHIRTKVTANIYQLYLIIFLFISYIFFLVLYGLLVSNPLLYINTEIWIYAVIFLCMFLSFYDVIWEDMYKPLVILFWIFFIPVVLGVNFPRLNLIEEGSVDHIMKTIGFLPGTASIAYEMYPILDFFPIVFVLSVVRKKIDIWKILGLCTILGYLGLHIYFQKRAPSIRALTYIFSAFCIFQIAKPSMMRMMKSIIPAIIGFILLISFVPIDGLVNRLNKSGEDKSRQTEARVMLTQLEPQEWIFGRGFGGYYISSAKLGLIYNLEFPSGEVGSTFTHIAFVYFILKGGILFLLFHLLLIAPLIYRVIDRKWLKNKYNFTAAVILPVYCLFLLIEGPFSTGAVFGGVLFGLGSGRLANSSKSIFELKTTRIKRIINENSLN